MGSELFVQKSRGEDAHDAFSRAVRDALYWHGHKGYTGTIAEKDSFVVISIPEGVDPFYYAYKLIEENDERINDKWGPAGCIEIKEEETKYYNVFLFFGWASS